MTVTEKQELNFIVCGGAGINIAKLLKTSSPSDRVKKAPFLALDASGNNRIAEELGIPLERVPMGGDPTMLATGSGKVRGTNYAEAQPFVERVMNRHDKGKFNIVICSGAGGSGSMLAVLVVRWLKQNNYNVILAVITDHTTQVEMENSIKTLQSMAVQTQPNFLNSTIPYMEFRNAEGKTRKNVDDEVLNKISLYSMFANGSNEEQDINDLAFIQSCSKHYGVPPALSHISFYDAPEKYTGRTPVAHVSLWTKAGDISSPFKDAVVRSTGVFSRDTPLPDGITQLHMLFDHGESIIKMEAQLEDLTKRQSVTQSTYTAQKDMSKGADSNGMML